MRARASSVFRSLAAYARASAPAQGSVIRMSNPLIQRGLSARVRTAVPSSLSVTEVLGMRRLGAAPRRIVMTLSMLLTVLASFADAVAAQLTLTWTAGSTDELGFSVKRSLGDQGTFSEVARTGHGVTSFIDAGLSDATTYCYRLRAFN